MLCSYIYGQCVYKVPRIFLNLKHVQVSFVHVTKCYMESRDVAPHILDFSNRRSWVLRLHSQAVLPLERTPISIQ